MWGMTPFGDLIVGVMGALLIWFFAYVIFFFKESEKNE
jgi:glycopeptide antibiotics resistance protein